jgi:hypothetical protein
MRKVLQLANEHLSECKVKLATTCTKLSATGMAISGSIMSMMLPASAAEEGDASLTTGLANVKTLLDWVWTAITGNTFLFTIFCMSLASMAFGLMRSAKRSPR